MSNPNVTLMARRSTDVGVSPEPLLHSMGHLLVALGDSPSVDAFSRLRTGTPHGIFDYKSITGRGVTQWHERLTGCIIVHGTVTGAAFEVGETITGGTSGKTGTITAVGSGNITYTTIDNDFEDGETITGSANSSTATVTSHNTGADITFQYDRSSVYLSLGTVQGQKVIRQTCRYFPYVPGYSHLINTTQVFGTGKTGVKQTVMYGDALNGLGMVLDGTTLKLLLRSSVSGSVVDTLTAKENWNIDPMDGTGPSGIVLDEVMAQIQGIDFQWLGVGRGRRFLNIAGINWPIHEENHANEIDSVYMKTPSLPVRYEIENTGTPASATTLEQICCTVSSEAGYALPGMEFSKGNTFASARDIADTSGWVPIFAIRVKTAFPAGEPNRRTVRYLGSRFAARSNDASFKTVHVHTPVTVTATWTSVDGSSGVEYSTDISAVTGMHEHEIDGADVFAGIGASGASASSLADFISHHSYIHQNVESDNSEMFVVYALSRAGTASVSARLTWVEAD